MLAAYHRSKIAEAFQRDDGRNKVIHAEGGFRPMLVDPETDPDEFHDLGKADRHAAVIDRLYAHLTDWGLRLAQRVTMSEDDIKAMRGRSLRRGIPPFLVDGSEVPDAYARIPRTGPGKRRAHAGREET